MSHSYCKKKKKGFDSVYRESIVHQFWTYYQVNDRFSNNAPRERKRQAEMTLGSFVSVSNIKASNQPDGNANLQDRRLLAASALSFVLVLQTLRSQTQDQRTEQATVYTGCIKNPTQFRPAPFFPKELLQAELEKNSRYSILPLALFVFVLPCD